AQPVDRRPRDGHRPRAGVVAHPAPGPARHRPAARPGARRTGGPHGGSAHRPGGLPLRRAGLAVGWRPVRHSAGDIGRDHAAVHLPALRGAAARAAGAGAVAGGLGGAARPVRRRARPHPVRRGAPAVALGQAGRGAVGHLARAAARTGGHAERARRLRAPAGRADLRPGTGRPDHRVRAGQPAAHGPGGGRLPGAAAALAPGGAHRDRGGGEAHPGGVRAVPPGARRPPGRGHRGAGRAGGHRGRVRRGPPRVARLLAGRPGGRGERVAVLHQPDGPGRAGAGGRRRHRAHRGLAGAVRGPAAARRARGAPGPGAARPRRHGRAGAARLAHVVVAPLGVGRAGAARRGGLRLAGPVRSVGGRHGRGGGGVRGRPAPAGSAPGRGGRAGLDAVAAGRGQHLRVVHAAGARRAGPAVAPHRHRVRHGAPL
ncbi:MAG: Probable conserved integral membrane protein, partial [uncultured Pseudonocardia sp.]